MVGALWRSTDTLEHARLLFTSFWSLFRWSTAMFEAGLLKHVWQMVSWHVLACLTDGLLTCFGMFGVRDCTTEFVSCLLKHFWQAVLLCFDMFWFEFRKCFRWHTARWYTDMFWHVCCLPLHNVSWRGCVWMIFCTVLRERCQVLYWVADRTRQDHAKIQKRGWRVCLFWNASPWIKSRWQPSPDNHHPTCHGGDHSK